MTTLDRAYLSRASATVVVVVAAAAAVVTVVVVVSVTVLSFLSSHQLQIG